ncbi:MAG: hypothetical protein ACTS4U_00795 [Candidatus Hodgkinia cicadicola]
MKCLRLGKQPSWKERKRDRQCKRFFLSSNLINQFTEDLRNDVCIEMFLYKTNFNAKGEFVKQINGLKLIWACLTS